MKGLYIHIPFCIKKCYYCDFLSFPFFSDESMKEYIELIIKEIGLLEESFNMDTIFIGGGTPTILPKGSIAKIMNAIREKFKLNPNFEATIEGNPKTLTEEKLKEYLDSGINRISIGIQSLDDKILKAIGRAHSAEDAIEALKIARKIGFKNINADLMYGLPFQDINMHLAAIDKIAPLVEHMSVYSLIIEPDTILGKQVKNENCILPSEDEEYFMHTLTKDALKKHGFNQYEISNYCIKGYECRHNINYWRCGDYLAAGLNASQAVILDNELIRKKITENYNEYEQAINMGRRIFCQEEKIDKSGRMFEAIMLGLRMNEGIERANFFELFDCDIVSHYKEACEKALASGLMEISSTTVRLTQKGMDLQNSLLMMFM